MRDSIAGNLVRKIAVVMLWAVLAPMGVAAVEVTQITGSWSVESAELQATLNQSDATLTVLDKRNHCLWQQSHPGSHYKVLSAATGENQAGTTLLAQIVADAPTPANPLSLAISVSGSQVSVTVQSGSSGDAVISREGIEYPFAFTLPAGEGHIVYPKEQGFVIPANEAAKEFFPGDSCQIVSWIGTTDLKKGCVMIVESNDDAAWSLARFSVHGKEQSLYQIHWLPSRGTLRYARTVSYDFTTDGGYVHLAKIFRNFAHKKGYLKLLTEKVRVNPNIEKMRGAPDIYVWGPTARTNDFLRTLKASGIDRAQINWDNCHGPVPSPEFFSTAAALGYVTGVYDIYQRVLDPGEIARAGRRVTSYEPGMSNMPENAVALLTRRDEQSRLVAQPRWWGSMYVACQTAMLPVAEARIPAEQATFGYMGRFYDTMGTGPLDECLSPLHPASRTDDRLARQRLLQVGVDHSLVLGSESCKDWMIPYIDWIEGRMQTGPGLPAEIIHEPELGPWDGDHPGDDIKTWEIPSRIGMTVHPTPAQLRHELDIRYRVPLWELVYHDAAMTTWHWHIPQQKIAGLWDFKDLENILYGTRPTFNLYESIWQEQAARFLQTYRNVCIWQGKIAYDEMVSHRWLSEDRQVQESVFASGARAIVNFGDTMYKEHNGPTVKPHNFVCLPP